MTETTKTFCANHPTVETSLRCNNCEKYICVRIPVVLDGFISTAGALIAQAIEPKVNKYLIASHVSAEKGHRMMLNY